MFPLLAIICKRSLVWTDWAPFFLLRVPSVTNWVTMGTYRSLQRVACLNLGQALLRLFGITTMRMLASGQLFKALSIPLMMSRSLKASFSSILLTLRPTFRFLAVLSIVATRPWTSEFRGCTMTQSMACRPEKTGWANRLKKDSFPLSTNLLAPSSSAGLGISLAWNLFILLLRLIPMSVRFFSSFDLSSSFMKPSISLNLSAGLRIVASLIFFLRVSSKSSGMPVIWQSSGIRQVGPWVEPVSSFLLILFWAWRRGCPSFLTVIPYLR